MNLDPIILARIQFAFTISFHIIFPAISIGLASFLAVTEGSWLLTRNKKYKNIYKFWVKIFAVTFGMGVVSGVVMSYQFGTNWSAFSYKIANVLGPLLAFEVLTAFFLEASFLGIMLFGWGRVSPRMHFAATTIVAIGTLISAFWILAANSWMQTPQGFIIANDGALMPTSWLEIIFNPSFPYRFIHMITAAYLTTAFFVGGVAAYYLLKNVYHTQAKIMLAMSCLLVSIVAPAQLIFGHMHGINTLEHQPVKLAAMEGNWDHHKDAPLLLFGIPSQTEEKTKYALELPYAASLVLTGDIHGTIPALKDFAPKDRPHVIIVFWSFRVMVGIGLIMIAIGLLSAIQYFRGRLFTCRWLHICWLCMTPSGFIAILAGWFVTETGRQPWTAYGVIRTADSVSPAIVAGEVAWSLLFFVIIYTFVFGAGTYYIMKIIRAGFAQIDNQDSFYDHGIESTVLKIKRSRGGDHA